MRILAARPVDPHLTIPADEPDHIISGNRIAAAGIDILDIAEMAVDDQLVLGTLRSGGMDKPLLNLLFTRLVRPAIQITLETPLALELTDRLIELIHIVTARPDLIEKLLSGIKFQLLNHTAQILFGDLHLATACPLLPEIAALIRNLPLRLLDKLQDPGLRLVRDDIVDPVWIEVDPVPGDNLHLLPHLQLLTQWNDLAVHSSGHRPLK